MADREERVVEERPVERETVVVDRDSGNGGRGPGSIIAIVIGLVVVLLVLWFVFGLFGGSNGGTDTTPVVPDDVNVDVNAPEGTGEPAQ